MMDPESIIFSDSLFDRLERIENYQLAIIGKLFNKKSSRKGVPVVKKPSVRKIKKNAADIKSDSKGSKKCNKSNNKKKASQPQQPEQSKGAELQSTQSAV